MSRPSLRNAIVSIAMAAAALIAGLFAFGRGDEEPPRVPVTDAEIATARVTIGRYCLARRAGKPATAKRTAAEKATELILTANAEDPEAMVGDQRRRDLLADAAMTLSRGCDSPLAARLRRVSSP